MTTRRMTLTAMLTALLCIAGPLTLPIGPVPLSMTTAALMLAAMLLPPGQAVLCCGLYLLIGLTGLPVFAGFTGGAGRLFGPTGGFLLGYLPLTAVGSLVCRRTDGRMLRCLGFLVGHVLLYFIGTFWYCHQAGAAPEAAIRLCVLPFLPGDAVKLALVLVSGSSLSVRLRKAGLM